MNIGLRSFCLVAICAVVSSGQRTSLAADNPAQKPNIVLIISDDQAWTDYHFMGHPAIATPNLDKLASQSLCFPRGYVPSSLCCPSLASIVTGLYPHQHKVTGNDPPRPAGMKPGEFYRSQAFQDGREIMTKHLEAAPTLPRVLGELGYLSLQTGKWWQKDPHRAGFTHAMTKGQRHGDEGLDIGRKTMQPIYDFIQEARGKNKPFFVWYAPMLPHDPHTPPQRILDKYKDKTPSIHVARYWAMCEWFDETCGQLLDYLDQQKLADNTIIIFLADNGWIQNSDNPRFNQRSKRSPYDGGLRTPLLVRWPAKIQPRKSKELAISIDIAPTLYAVLGLKPTSQMQGVNLLDDKAVSARKTIYGECFTHDFTDLEDPAKNLLERWIIDGNYKLILPAPASEMKKPELYEILADPDERKDLAGASPDTVKQLSSRLDAWWKP